MKFVFCVQILYFLNVLFMFYFIFFFCSNKNMHFVFYVELQPKV